LDLRAILKTGVHLTLDEIDADELYAMMVVEKEQDRFEEEKAKQNNGR
jgi:hypothetical protein